MQICTIPKELPKPTIDYANYDWEKAAADEEKHMADLKAWLIDEGYNGEHTGRIFKEPIADGYALYMVADGPTSALVHLPYGDAYHSENVQYLPKDVVLERCARDEAIRCMFSTAALENR